ncbi:hypothetical protein Poly30_28710 [Planctomycetes bacterium Poly30]|uniref:Uncharacterized protein n=1 Tax=Saltatorellus ferox TaxID=2528018 RepID=A0A518ETC9_9BACT|nr:hypothetical protein Poly30_28710 [Planctomycetes bacterium Poly30]
MGKKRKPAAFKLPKLGRAKSKPQPSAPPESRLSLAAQDTETSLPPVFAASDREVIYDPWARLGVEAAEARDAASIEAAFRKALTVTTPERDPEGARALMEARRFLLSPENALLREVGDLRVPNPESFIEGYTLSDPVRELVQGKGSRAEEPAEAAETAVPAPPEVEWSSHARLATLMTLLALVEAEIEGDFPKKAPKSKQAELF